MLEVDSHIVRATDGQSFLNSSPDFGALEEDEVLSYTETRGRVRATASDLVNVQDSGHVYRVAEPEAPDSHVASQGGVRFYINANKYDLEAVAFGVQLTGDPADAAGKRAALQRAIDHLDDEGQGGRIRLGNEGHCMIDLPPC